MHPILVSFTRLSVFASFPFLSPLFSSPLPLRLPPFFPPLSFFSLSFSSSLLFSFLSSPSFPPSPFLFFFSFFFFSFSL
ncbi:hypothetical protein ACXWRW_10785, partial [Streptococcus pyogenes]